jgi:hypothetical protein
MKKNPLKIIEELIPELPGKDAELSKKFLKERNFEYLLEIVESDIYKASKANRLKQPECENIFDNHIAVLMKLREELLTYMSYLDVPDNSDDYDYFT